MKETIYNIRSLDLEEAHEHLVEIALRDLALFEEVYEDLGQYDFLEELREEEHNGYPMYPELSDG